MSTYSKEELAYLIEDLGQEVFSVVGFLGTFEDQLRKFDYTRGVSEAHLVTLTQDEIRKKAWKQIREDFYSLDERVKNKQLSMHDLSISMEMVVRIRILQFYEVFSEVIENLDFDNFPEQLDSSNGGSKDKWKINELNVEKLMREDENKEKVTYYQFLLTLLLRILNGRK